MDDAAYMRLAIAKAREGIASGQTPFGACIVRGGKVLACCHNEVWAKNDVTAHAEVQALRAACAELKAIDLDGATIYCTCEPCPMCFGAIHWARIPRIVYGASIADAKKFGFNELSISNQTLKAEGHIRVQVEGGLLLEENCELFRIWAERADRRFY